MRPKKYAEGQGRIIVLDDGQIDASLTSAIASADPDLWLFVAIALGTCMRHMEIFAARWDHVDLARRRLFIPHAKAGQREQPMSAELAGTLAREKAMRTDQIGFIFPARNADSGLGHSLAWVAHFVTQWCAPGSTRQRLLRTPCATRQLRGWCRPGSTYRPYRGYRGTRRSPWCCAIPMSAPRTSTRRSRHSNTAEPGLHQNYTRRPGRSLDQNSQPVELI